MIDDVGVPIISMVSFGPSASVKQMVDSQACSAPCIDPRERDIDRMLFVSLLAAFLLYRLHVGGVWHVSEIPHDHTDTANGGVDVTVWVYMCVA